MSLILLCLVLGLIPAAIARAKGRSAFGWWIYGSILFLIALPHALLLDSIEASRTLLRESGRRRCPYCAEVIQAAATLCRFCQRDLSDENMKVCSSMECGTLIPREAATCPHCNHPQASWSSPS